MKRKGCRRRNYGFLSLLILMNIGCASSRVEYIAHRGASFRAPENTLASVLLAWQLGADSVEVDVHLTRDHRIAVIHDEDTRRVSDADLKISRASLEELQKLDVGRWKDERYAGEKIPSIEEILETIPKDKRLYIEIKCKEEILPYLKKLLAEHKNRSRITLIGFDLKVVTESKKQMPDIPVYWLVGTKKEEATGNPIPHDPRWPAIAAQNGIDGLNVHHAGVDDSFMKAVRDSGQDLYVWTVDDPETANRLIALGVKGITTNRPQWLKQQVEKNKPPQETRP